MAELASSPLGALALVAIATPAHAQGGAQQEVEAIKTAMGTNAAAQRNYTWIQTSEVADKGVFHRVRVGPYRAMGDVERVRSLLTQNNIPTTLVKEIPTPQETP